MTERASQRRWSVRSGAVCTQSTDGPVQTLLLWLLTAALPGRTVILVLQMSRWDPRGEFAGPRGRAMVCRVPTLNPKLALSPRAAHSAQAPVWPETLVWEPVLSEDLPVYSWQIRVPGAVSPRPAFGTCQGSSRGQPGWLVCAPPPVDKTRLWGRGAGVGVGHVCVQTCV